MKKHNADEVETIDVFLNEEKFPKAFKAKLEELVESGMTEESAKHFIEMNPFQMELYYSKDSGLFMVETEAVDGGSIINPYTGKELEECEF